MKQQLITFDNAVLAKELGFDYNEEVPKEYKDEEDVTLSRPYQSFLADFLRETYNCHVYIIPNQFDFRRLSYQIDYFIDGEFKYIDSKDLKEDYCKYDSSYAEVLSAGLRRAMELIKLHLNPECPLYYQR